jgi:transcriptional regulator EpsA
MAMTLTSKLSGNEQNQFLGVMFESLAVDRRSQLGLWLQGDLQRFLPHEALVVVVGDFVADRLTFEILSPVPSEPDPGCKRCNLRMVSAMLFDRWQNNGRHMLTFDGPWAQRFDGDCRCLPERTRHSGPLALAHGLRDERSGEDALYIALRSSRPFDDRQRKMFALLMPTIDHACRRAVAPTGEEDDQVRGFRTTIAITEDDRGLSAREVEILEWVRFGKTNHEIGIILGISPFTVKNHLQRIFRKIDVINRTQAVAKFEGYRRAAT